VVSLNLAVELQESLEVLRLRHKSLWDLDGRYSRAWCVSFQHCSLNLTVELQESLSINGTELFSASLRKDDIPAHCTSPLHRAYRSSALVSHSSALLSWVKGLRPLQVQGGALDAHRSERNTLKPQSNPHNFVSIIQPPNQNRVETAFQFARLDAGITSLMSFAASVRGGGSLPTRKRMR